MRTKKVNKRSWKKKTKTRRTPPFHPLSPIRSTTASGTLPPAAATTTKPRAPQSKSYPISRIVRLADPRSYPRHADPSSVVRIWWIISIAGRSFLAGGGGGGYLVPRELLLPPVDAWLAEETAAVPCCSAWME
jgi:hypothetical protein